MGHKGHYGKFGGMYLPEILMPALLELQQQWDELWSSSQFRQHFYRELAAYAGRPTPLTKIPRFSEAIKANCHLYLKREDLLHTGAHKLNNALGQCLVALSLKKQRIIAETGAGQHGVATATACARLGLQCVIYMGATDMARQHPNVEKMKLLGAEVRAVTSGSAILKEAVNEALRDWSYTYETSHYCLGSALGPHPYPEMVREFQSLIGQEIKAQGPKPDLLIACLGGGSNAIGMFAPFLDDPQVKMIGVEAGGNGSRHAARFSGGRPGVLHGAYTYLLQDKEGQVQPTHSISAGLDYPAVGPEHAHLFETKRVLYQSVTDSEALDAFLLLSKSEGIIPALESSHALGYVMKHAKQFDHQAQIIVNLSGRGDKDLPQLLKEKFL